MSDSRERASETHHANPDHAATDPAAAARQDQVKADHAALEESARRIDATVNENSTRTDPQASARDAQRRADHDALERSADRVAASVPADVRDTPVQPANVTRSARDNERR